MNEFEIPSQRGGRSQRKRGQGGGFPCSILFLLGLIILAMLALLYVNLEPYLPGILAIFDNSVDCQVQVEQALLLADESCQQVGTNQACYGNRNLAAMLSPGYTDRFVLSGDVLPFEGIQRLSASALNADTGEWGVSVMRMESSQDVRLIMLGETMLENRSVDLKTITFSTSSDPVACHEAAYDGLLAITSEGSNLVLRANEVEINVTGTALLRAVPFVNLTVDVIKGGAVVVAGGQERLVAEGQRVAVPLGGEEGLSADGPPSEPHSASQPLPDLQCILDPVACRPQPENTATPQEIVIPTNTAIPAETNTPGTPTDTPLPGTTIAPPPTNTPIPTVTETSTALAAACQDIVVSPGSGAADFTIDNGYPSDITLNTIVVNWPTANGNLREVKLQPATIWTGDQIPAFASLTLTSEAADRTIPMGESRTLTFEFEDQPAASGYSITLAFNVPCSRTASK